MFSYGSTLVPWLSHCWYCCWDSLGIEDFGSHSWLEVDLQKKVIAVAASASRRVDILRKTMGAFKDVSVVAKCFWTFILLALEYSSPVWMPAATSHLLLLDHVVSRVSQLSGGRVCCDLWHRREVASLCIFFFHNRQFGLSPCADSFSCTICDENANPWCCGGSCSQSFQTLLNHFLLQDWLGVLWTYRLYTSIPFLDRVGVLWTYRLYTFTHAVFGLVFLGGV